MTTQHAQQPRPTFSYAVTVKSRSETPDGFKLELDIPAFNSKFPTVITRVPLAMGQLLVPGSSHTLLLERQNLKPDKTGTQLFDYYYGLKEIVVPSQTAPTASVAGATPTKPPVTEKDVKDFFPLGKDVPVDATRASIEAQTCLIQARELLQVLVAMHDGTEAEKLAFIKANWPVLAHIAKATLNEVAEQGRSLKDETKKLSWTL